MPAPNWASGTVWTGDNLRVLRGMNSESVDLIYLDPPFNSNRTYEAPIGSKAAGASFKDAWTLNDVDVCEHGELADRNPAAYSVIDAARQAHGKGMMSYLIFMAVRLFELHRVLKDTGSIYLHCDPTASHYLKLLMDAVFGRSMYRNEIIWHYRRWPSKQKNFQRMHDVIFRYARGEDVTWNQLFDPLSPETMKRIKGGKKIVTSYDEESGKKRIRPTGETSKGVPMRDVWEIKQIVGPTRERMGYPTQKPLALVERVIRASSNPGDMVLDPFCGCATALVMADRLERRWAGIDLSPLAVKLVDERIAADRGKLPWGGGNGPHGAAQAHGHRQAPQLPDPPPPALRRARRRVRGLRNTLPLPRYGRRSRPAEVTGRDGSPGQPATALLRLQPQQGRQDHGRMEGYPMTKKNDKPEAEKPEKAPRGRPAKLVMPDPIPDTPENIARACMTGPPKDDWDYLKPGSGAKVED